MNELQKELLEVKKEIAAAQADATVQRLMKSVAQNPSTEEFDLEKSQITVTDAVNLRIRDNGSEDDLRAAAEKINVVLLHLQAIFTIPQDLSVTDTRVYDAWWFENLTRVKKMLIVAKVLACRRLMSFTNPDGTSVVPTPLDTPSQIMELWVAAKQFETERQPEYRKKYAKMLGKRVEREFLELGYGYEIATTKKAANEFLLSLVEPVEDPSKRVVNPNVETYDEDEQF